MTDYQNNSIKRKQIEYKVKIEYQLAVLEKINPLFVEELV
jgi:hypothetical protein